jgi:hypothetical protein
VRLALSQVSEEGMLKSCNPKCNPLIEAASEPLTSSKPDFRQHFCTQVHVMQWGKPTVTWIWEEQILERLERAALLCGQIGVLCTVVVGLLNVVAEAVELIAKKRRTRN